MRTKIAASLALAASAFAIASPASAASFTRGPYLQDLTSRGVAIMGGLEAAHTVSVDVTAGVNPGGALVKHVDGGAADIAYEITVDSLAPSTAYRYTVKTDDGATQSGTFTTAPEDDRPFSFLVYGDDRSDDAAHAQVVAQMQKAPGDFLVQTGDMVGDGAEPQLWEQFFTIERDLLRDRCLFPAIGNHEEYHVEGAARYARLFRVGGPSSAAERWYTFRWGIARFFVLDSNDDFTGDQKAWLHSSLAAADAEQGLVWRFVVMHHGPYSSSIHGPNAAFLAAKIPALLSAHHVDLIFAGHDHVYERGEGDGLRYVISGGGGAPLYPQQQGGPAPTTERFESVHHYLKIELSKAGGVMTATRADGSMIERCTFAAHASGWGCPSPNAPNAGKNAAPASQAPPSANRACDCATGRAGGHGTAAALAVIAGLAATIRRRSRPGGEW